MLLVGAYAKEQKITTIFKLKACQEALSLYRQALLILLATSFKFTFFFFFD